MNILSNVCEQMVGSVIHGLDYAVFETVFWLNRKYLSLENVFRYTIVAMDEFPVAKCIVKGMGSMVWVTVTLLRYLGTSLFYSCVEHEVPYIATYTLSNTMTGYRLKETADTFSVVDYPDMDIFEEIPEEDSDDEEEDTESEEGPESWNQTLHDAGVRAILTVEECQDVCECLIVAKNENNGYLVKTYAGEKQDSMSILEWHANTPSQVSFLTIEYSHPRMKSPLSITLSRDYFYVGNEILSAAFLMRYIGYQSIFTDTAFDASYVVHLIDDEINQIELHWGQYLVLGKFDYRVVDRANLSTHADCMSVCEKLHRVQMVTAEKEHMD
jgi:hypothetical protein